MNKAPMVVRYSCRHRRFFWLYGLLALLWGGMGLTADSDPGWIDFGWILMGLLCLAGYVWYWRTPYLRVEGETLLQPGFPARKIPLADLRRVRTFAGDLILESENTKITLVKGAAHPEDLKAVDEFLGNHLTAKSEMK